jgi:glutathione peroxidase
MKILSLALASLLVASAPARAASLFEIPLQDIDGHATTLASCRGRVLLIVNVASECGYTPQYQGLQALHEKFQAKGLVVLGFPCNQFGGQEPGSNAEIKRFCSTTFHVTFPLFDKLQVNGPGATRSTPPSPGPDRPSPATSDGTSTSSSSAGTEKSSRALALRRNPRARRSSAPSRPRSPRNSPRAAAAKLRAGYRASRTSVVLAQSIGATGW